MLIRMLMKQNYTILVDIKTILLDLCTEMQKHMRMHLNMHTHMHANVTTRITKIRPCQEMSTHKR